MTNPRSTARPSRRALLAGVGGGAVAATLGGLPANARTAREIDVSVDVALEELFTTVRGSRGLYNNASGVLVIPDVVKAGFVFAGAYGEGALRVRGRTVGYWRYAAASVGFQAGAQTTRQALFFMTRPALDSFRFSDGWEVGADAELTVIQRGAEASVDTTTETRPVIAVVYGRQGLLGGASLQGGRYLPIDP